MFEIAGVTFGYRSGLVFQNFSWCARNTITILEGPSGCGKTTFLRLIAGHLKAIQYSVWRVPDHPRLILQDDGLFPWLTAEGNLSLVSGWKGFGSLPNKVKELAELVKPFSHQVVGTLSFGQRRLLELLRALFEPTPLLLLDEPLNFLDSIRRRIVIDLIKTLANQGINFVISSHYETDYLRLQCERLRFSGDMPYQMLQSVG